MEYMINSSQNKIIKYVKSLHVKKNRDELCLYIAEGIKICYEALHNNEAIKFAVFNESYKENQELCDLMNDLKAIDIDFYVINNKLFSDISEMETPQGVILVISKKDYTKLISYDKEKMNIIILDGIKDPGNLGTIVRSADAFNVDAILLSKGCVDLYNSKTIRSTMGSIFHIPIVENLQLSVLLQQIKASGFKVIGADPHADIDISGIERYEKTAIIVGSESQGISEISKNFMDIAFKIPMPGKAESLNASVAASLAMYELFLKNKT